MYDITIVGCGISGLFLALCLKKTMKEVNILMLDKGVELSSRLCPMQTNNLPSCLNCSICHKYSGFGGLGMSEGKYNYSLKFGGNLVEKIGEQHGEYYLQKVDTYLTELGGEKAPYYSTHNPFTKVPHNTEIITTSVRHLGTELSINILDNMYRLLKQSVRFEFCQTVLNVEKDKDSFLVHTDKSSFLSKKVVIATGNSGYAEFGNICENLGIIATKKRIDFGLRIELLNEQLCEILQDTFEIKVAYKDNKIDCMTYCMNPAGRVVKRNQNGFTFTDGQNNKEFSALSKNANFAVLVSKYFIPDEGNKYYQQVMKKLNQKNNRLVVQRLGDLYLNRPTSEEQLRNNTVIPSLMCESGNLYDEVPTECINGALKLLSLIQEMSNTAVSSDTLLYGLDAKIYPSEIEIDSNFETLHKGLFVIGDCSGFTNSLSHAAATGLFLGDYICKEAMFLSHERGL